MTRQSGSTGSRSWRKLWWSAVCIFVATTGIGMPAHAQAPPVPAADAPIANLPDFRRMRCDALAWETNKLYLHYSFCIPNAFYRRRLKQPLTCSPDFRGFERRLRPIDQRKWLEIRRVSRMKRCPG